MFKSAVWFILTVIVKWPTASAGLPLAIPEFPASFCGRATRDFLLPNTLRLAHFNVWNYDDGPDWAARKNVVFQFLAEQRPDIITLNEIRVSPEKSMFTDFCDFLIGDWIGVFQPSTNYSDGTVEGVALFSRYKLSNISARHLHFLSENVLDLNHRVVLGATIRLSTGRDYAVFVSHFSYDNEQRIKNAIGACIFINTYTSKYKAFLADFNAVEEDDFAVQFVKTALQLEDFEESEFTYCNCGHPTCNLSERPDRMLFSTHGQKITSSHAGPSGAIKGVCPSDHRSVFAEVKFSEIAKA